MRWRYVSVDHREIELEYADHPGWFETAWSPEVGPYLESLTTDRVPVVFQVTRDLGKVRGYVEVRIGELDGTHFQPMGNGLRGSPAGPSPWR